MMVLTLLFAVILIEFTTGRPPLPTLPSKDGCYLTSEELEVFRMEGEAVVLHFPTFKRTLRLRRIALTSAQFTISKNNETEQQDGGRVQLRDEQLWFLPAQPSDSGEYVCSYRNESFCISGNIRLRVFESSSVDVGKLSYPVSALVGEELKLRCPSLSHFNRTDRRIEWFKDSSQTPLQRTDSGSSLQDRDKLVITAVRTSHTGRYTCRLLVSINQQQFNISRVLLLQVEDLNPVISTTSQSDLSVTSESQSIPAVPHAPMIPPPVIILPSNGTVYESAHGSALEMSCLVLTGCEVAHSTEVSWLVNGQSVESSYLDNRALQGGLRVTQVSTDCQIEVRLIVMGITEEDEQTQIKCVAQNDGGMQEVVALLQLEDPTSTWLVVSAVGASCFLVVVSVFLYVLYKPKREKKDHYFLARQDSSVSFT